MEDLSDEQLAELKTDLLVLRAELQHQLDSTRQSSEAVDLDQPIGRLSRMDALQQQAMAKANRAGSAQRLQQVEVALQAIRQGRYGECRRCEEPVGYARLKARPESPLCLVCQELKEKGH